MASLSRNETFGMKNNAISLLCRRNKDGIYILIPATDNDSRIIRGGETDKTEKGMKDLKHFWVIKKTRPCEQGNWDTWMVLDPWNQV